MNILSTRIMLGTLLVFLNLLNLTWVMESKSMRTSVPITPKLLHWEPRNQTTNLSILFHAVRLNIFIFRFFSNQLNLRWLNLFPRHIIFNIFNFLFSHYFNSILRHLLRFLGVSQFFLISPIKSPKIEAKIVQIIAIQKEGCSLLI
jgi:hypothetical protein